MRFTPLQRISTPTLYLYLGSPRPPFAHIIQPSMYATCLYLKNTRCPLNIRDKNLIEKYETLTMTQQNISILLDQQTFMHEAMYKIQSVFLHTSQYLRHVWNTTGYSKHLSVAYCYYIAINVFSSLKRRPLLGIFSSGNMAVT
jgi:hypothetical protein